jgi:arylsulfatase A-like enzyme
MLMTGHHANSTGVWHTIGGRSLLRRDEWSVASAFKESGYKTSLFGKWHLGDNYPYRPGDRGFDQVITHGGGGISQVSDWWGNDYFDDTYLVNGVPQKFKGYCTDVWFNEATKHIEIIKDDPFFCCITVNAPHEPYNVDNKYSDSYRGLVPEDRARFYGMIGNIDENFGKLRRKLDELDLTDNTILIFMTDNGSSCGCSTDPDTHFVLDGYNGGMRGMKCSEYEGGHRVPFFMQWPGGGISTGRDENSLTSAVDFMPTMLGLCGIEVPGNRRFHGLNLKPLIEKGDEKLKDRFIVTDSQRITNPVKWRKSSVMSGLWRLINGTELYNLEDDPEQKFDLSEQYPQLVKEHREAYEEWWELVSKKFDSTIPIDFLKDSSVKLCCHDWRNDESHAPYQQNHIREGLISNGYWEVDVLSPGKFQFELYRWPEESGHRITDGIEGDDVEFRRDAIAEKDWIYYHGGESLPIVKAGIKIAGLESYSAVLKGDLAASFSLELPAGETRVQTWFYESERELESMKLLSDEESRKYVRGAYYVRVTPVKGDL